MGHIALVIASTCKGITRRLVKPNFPTLQRGDQTLGLPRGQPGIWNSLYQSTIPLVRLLPRLLYHPACEQPLFSQPSLWRPCFFTRCVSASAQVLGKAMKGCRAQIACDQLPLIEGERVSDEENMSDGANPIQGSLQGPTWTTKKHLWAPLPSTLR